MDWEDAYHAQFYDACTGRLVRGIVHNFNGIHQVLALHTELLQRFFVRGRGLLDAIAAGEDGALDELRALFERRSDMGSVEEALGRAGRTVDRIARLAENQGNGGNAPAPLAEIAAMEDEFLCADPFFKHRIERVYDLAADLPLVRASRTMFHTVLFLLLSNATDALRDHDGQARITVTAATAADHLLLQVFDTGPGIAHGLLPNLFTPFVTAREGHLGLGLYQARRLVSDFEGEIEADSSERGTGVTVRVPCKRL